MGQIERHNIEYKESWSDEYLKWICGFANASGGSIFIGLDDNGKPVRKDNIKKLSEDIPNKVRDVLGIMVDVLVKEKDGVDYLEIKVAPYDFAVSYKSRYYYRSGSTNSELRGSALTHFLLGKSGRSWDGITDDSVGVDELSDSALKLHLDKAILKGRLNQDVKNMSATERLTKLHLIENGKLTRAAILLFHPEPEDFVPGAFVKIGAFGDDGTLRYHDEVHGPVIEQIEKAYDLIMTKYSIFNISYDGIQRIETAQFPEKSVREALVNALLHKDYSDNTPIQLKVYSNKIVFWNPGQLPAQWSMVNLREEHVSMPINKKMAHALYLSGDIEAWGQGTLEIISSSLRHSGVPPIFCDRLSGIMVSIYKTDDAFYSELELDDRMIKIIKYIQKSGRVSNKDVQSLVGVSKATATRLLQSLSEMVLVRRGVGAGAYYCFK